MINLKTIFLVALVLMVWAIFAQAEEISTTVRFSSADLSFRMEKGYDLVGLRGCNSSFEVGKPQIPVRVVSLVIPPETQVKRVYSRQSSGVSIEGEYNLYPVQELVAIGEEPKWTDPVPEVYSSSLPYPGELVEYLGEGCLAGNRLVSIAVYPIYSGQQETIVVFRNRCSG